VHALALDVGAGILPERKRFGIIAELDADFLEHPIRIALDKRQPLFIEHVVLGDLAGDVGKRNARATTGARRAARCSAPAATATALSLSGCLFCRLVHGRSSEKRRWAASMFRMILKDAAK